MELQDRLILFRGKNRLTLREAAKLLGVSVDTVSRIELGKVKPQRRTASTIELALTERGF